MTVFEVVQTILAFGSFVIAFKSSKMKLAT
ncbi:putative holin-like toxin [Streptococcus hyointestinalis]